MKGRLLGQRRSFTLSSRFEMVQRARKKHRNRTVLLNMYGKSSGESGFSAVFLSTDGKFSKLPKSHIGSDIGVLISLLQQLPKLE